MSSSVDLIKEKLDIVDVVGSYIKLEKAGGNLKAKCPFHNEKTPSFFVSPGRSSYYCFGCGAKGDIFTFVQEFEGLDFRGALKVLADRAGVELVAQDPKLRDEKERLYSALEQAAFFFEKQFSETPEAKRYMLNRGVTEATIKEWRIGYAPLEWEALHSFLLSKGVTSAELVRVGLVKKSEKKAGEHYDVFRGRIMFPIFDSGGKIIAFSGRILVDDGKSAKYINTPETELFDKSSTLYGLHKAKVDIRRKDYSILVEGQIDLVMAHQHGFSNTIASSGTAFTEFHLAKLKKLSNRIIMAFDADGAGFAAANKSAQLALSLGMEVKVALLPKGTDPAELIKTNLLAWRDALKNAMHIINFYIESLRGQNLDPRKLGKEIEHKVLPYVNMLESTIERSHFVSRIASQMGIKEEAIWEDLKKLPRATPGLSNPATLDQRKDTVSIKKSSIEKKILGIYLWQKSTEEPAIDPAQLLDRQKTLIGAEALDALQKSTSDAVDEMLFEAEAYYQGSETLHQEIEELFGNLEEEKLKKEFTETMALLSAAERAKDVTKAEALLAQCQELSKKIALLPKRK